MFFFSAGIIAQGGGPPMITDDPGTPDPGAWEINISFDSEILSRETTLETPLLDINYGFNERTQLKVESPYLLTKVDGERFDSRAGDITLGVKYRFFDEGKYWLAFSIYPQVTLSTEKDGDHEYLFPVQLQKSLGRLVLGADFGYAYVQDKRDFFQSGLLIGYGFSAKFEAMGEVNFQAHREAFPEAIGTVNFGVRYEVSETLKLIGSMGTGLISPGEAFQVEFISFAGIQLNI